MKVGVCCLFLWLLVPAAAAQPLGAIRNLPGFAANAFGPNDDGTHPCTGPGDGVPPNCTPLPVPIGFSINFYGAAFSSLYVNNNGNVTFDQPLGGYTPPGLTDTEREIIAPFFADVDTRAGNTLTFGNDTVDGHQAFGVNWLDVGYYLTNTDKLNSFQLVLVNRSDRNPGDFDIEFNYNQIQWETGDGSGGVDGLGGSSAVAGFSDGSGLPGTYFQLNGSGIPGEFLDNNPGGLIHGGLNTNVPGRYLIPIVNLTNTVLHVQRFSQGDPRWAANTYADSHFTIQQKGCALSSLAMALAYAGVATDPGALDSLMHDHGDFVGTSVNWDAATRDASDHTLQFHANRSADTQYLSQALAEGHPVIVGVNLNTSGCPSHFVLVIGEQSGQFIINDPGHANAATLDYYDNTFETRGYVGAPPGDLSGFDISVVSAPDLLVVDPLGRRTGRDPASGLILAEIPQAAHFSDCIEESDLTGAPGTDTAHMVEICQPVQGHYQILLVGTNGGSYQLTLRPFSQNGTPEPPLALQGTKASDTIAQAQADLASAGVTSEPFTNQCPWSVSPTNGPLALTVQFTAPDVDSSGNALTSWNWHFGDGWTGTRQNPSHTYAFGGTFSPTLTAIDNAGNTVVGFGTAILLPTVLYAANPTRGLVPLAVQFTSPNLDSGGHPIVSWNWDFGDGSASTLQNPSHHYITADSFVPNLIATNNNGLTVSGFGPSITVSLPTVAYTANPTRGLVPLTVQFTSSDVDSASNAIVSWNWDFGDRYASTGQKPSHIYTANGVFSPSLVATNSAGIEVLGSGPSIEATIAPVDLGLVVNGGFETGDFSGWTTNGNFTSTSVTNDSASVHSGTFGAALGAFGSLGYLAQTLPTIAGARYALSFWLESPDGQTPNEFLVSWNGNTLLDGTNLPALGWTNVQLVVTATGTTTILQFGFLDDPSFLALDDVSVSPQPAITRIRLSGTNLVIDGSNGLLGAPCYVLMSTNLAQPLSHWLPVATNNLPATGPFSITASNAVSPNARQRFYILRLQ